MVVRCGWPIKTSINNINCRATPGRNHLPRSKGTVRLKRGGDDVLRLINTHVMLRMDDGGGGGGSGSGGGGGGCR